MPLSFTTEIIRMWRGSKGPPDASEVDHTTWAERGCPPMPYVPYPAHGWHVPQLGPLRKTPFRSAPWHTAFLQEELPFEAT